MGRDDELELLYSRLGDAIAGNGSFVLISGEAGIGKTRILEGLGEVASKIGFLKLEGSCIPGIPLSYLPFLEAFRAFAKGPFSSDDPLGRSVLRDNTSVLFDSLELLTNQSATQPLLICLDDLHWADSASIQLLLFLARNIKKLRVLIVGTYRPEDLVSSEEGEVHPLQSSIRQMIREGTLAEIHLERLSMDDISRAIEGMLGGPADIETKSKIFEQSGGNPLFAVETLRLLISENKLIQRNGTWMLEGIDEISIPRTIQEVVLRRIEKLNLEQRRILECASVIGESFDSSLVSESIEIDKLHLLNELDIISRDFLLVAEDEAGFSFSHARIRDITYEAITRSKRLELHRRVGDSLEKRPLTDAFLSALSWHFYQAGERERCMKYSINAGERFLSQSSYFEAISHYKRALEAISNDSGHREERLMILEGLGDSYLEQCLSRESLKHYDEFLSLSPNPRDRARVLCKSAENWNPANLGKGEAAHALQLLEQAEACEGLDSDDMANIEFRRARVLYYIEELDKAADSIKRAIDLFESTGDQFGAMDSMQFHCAIKMNQLLFTEALDDAKVLLQRANESKNRRAQIEAEWNISVILSVIYCPEQTLIHLSRCEDLASKSGDLDALFSSAEIQSEIKEMEGDFSSAKRCAERAVEYAVALNDTIALAIGSTQLGRCRKNCGDLDAADESLAVGCEAIQQLSGVLRKWFEGFWLWSKAELESARGRDPRQVGYYELAIAMLEDGGPRHWDWAAMCHCSYANELANYGLLPQAKEHIDKAYQLCTEIKRPRLRKRVEKLVESLQHQENGQ